jgi:hypothetical protein
MPFHVTASIKKEATAFENLSISRPNGVYAGVGLVLIEFGIA